MKSNDIAIKWKNLTPQIVNFAIVFSFAIISLSSKDGISNLKEKSIEETEIQKKIADIDKKIAKIKEQTLLLSLSEPDPDVLDCELKKIGYYDKNAVIIFYD